MPKRGKKRYWNQQPSVDKKNTKSIEETSASGSMPSQRPPGLRGKEIGLYYRNLNKNKIKKDYVINFNIPHLVLKKVKAFLQSIENTEEGKIIKDTFMKTYGSSSLFNYAEVTFKKPPPVTLPEFIPVKLETDEKPFIYPCDIENDESPQPISFPSFSAKPGPSSTPDFIKIEKEEPSEYDAYPDFVSHRNNGDYFKFGYHDIITGSFEEKLDECMFKGITINKTNADIESLNEAYYCDYEEMIKKQKYQKMLLFRTQLPTYKKTADILQVIDNNQVTVISGETGCGKSTQVPQIILDNAILKRKGANTKIMVTQPRRIAASSLAARVAEERAENIGVSTGYILRLERINPRPRCSITFCTTGVLLAELESNQALSDISHVILDEVHERDSHVDLTMCMLKQIIKKRKDLKVILMSATLDADRLSEYFNGCPVMHIEGLAYPVQDIYLEDILRLTKFTLDNVPQQNHYAQHRRPYRGRKNETFEMRKDIAYKAEIRPWIESIKGKIDINVYRTLLNYKIEDMNYDLILELLKYICKGEPGAVLVFLPGIGEITTLLRTMDESNAFPKSSFDIYALHSKLNSLEQHRIFERAPPGKRKIIVATNIAETSITIDDIVYVVDCAKIKIKGLNIQDNLSTLKVEWVSQANLRQRRGRAGRCQPGICYHIMTSYRASTLQERLLPELQRSDLLEAVLSIKKLRLGTAVEALNMVPDPPALSTVEWAVSHLRQCGALNANEILTPLGWHMARLPVHPAAGKLLILGTLFGCLNRAACIAAIWSFKDPYNLVIGKEQEVDEVRRKFAVGEPSDHVGMSEAIIQWERSGNERRAFAYKNFLSNNTLELLLDMKKQLGDNLRQMGFLPSGNVKSSWENRNNDNLSLFKAIIAASLYPNIASVRWMGLHKLNKTHRIIARTAEGRVDLHPSSVMSTNHKCRGATLCDNPGANWLVYWLRQKSRDVYLIDVTLVYTLPLLFFGELNIIDVDDSPKECIVSISKFKVRCQKETAVLLLELRSLLNHVMANKVASSSSHSVRHNDFEEAVLKAVIEIITAEDERVEYVKDDDDMSGSDYSDYEANNKTFQR